MCTMSNVNLQTQSAPASQRPKSSIVAQIFVGLVFAGLLVYCFRPSSQGFSLGKRLQCMNNARNVALAVLNYACSYKEFPPAYMSDSTGRPLYSWRVLILPFLEEAELYNEFHLDEPWDSPHNLTLLEKCPKIFQCPALEFDPTKGETTYAMIIGPNAISNGPKSIEVDGFDKPQESVILIAESNRRIPWTAPKDIPMESLRLGLIAPNEETAETPGVAASHNGSTVVVYADGNAETLPPSTSSQLLFSRVPAKEMNNEP